MFRRVILESWQEYIPYICFALIGGAFLIVVIRALRMPKSDVQHLASMPLRDDGELLAAQAKGNTIPSDSDSDSDSDTASR